MMKIIRDTFLTKNFFLATGGIVFIFILSFIADGWIIVPKVLLLVFIALVLTDVLLVYRTRKGIYGYRSTPEKLSNGDPNEIQLFLENFFPFTVRLEVIDEIPHQFQKRDVLFKLVLPPRQKKTIHYELRPIKRGEYSFGTVNVFVRSPIQLINRRFRFSQNAWVPVYPSYQQMRKYELLAISNRLTEAGVKKIRRIGQNREFEMIKDYV